MVAVNAKLAGSKIPARSIRLLFVCKVSANERGHRFWASPFLGRRLALPDPEVAAHVSRRRTWLSTKRFPKERRVPRRGPVTIVGADEAEFRKRLQEIEAAGKPTGRVRFIVTGVTRADSYASGWVEAAHPLAALGQAISYERRPRRQCNSHDRPPLNGQPSTSQPMMGVTPQHYLGHRSIVSTVRYTALATDRFKDFWKD